MKILSKYKDYYDYLSGVWGEDPKIILDRRIFNIPQFYSTDKNKWGSIFICGDQVDFVYSNGKFLYLDELEKTFGVNKLSSSGYFARYFTLNFNKFKTVNVPNPNNGRSENIFTEIVRDEKQLNLKYECPILLTFYGNEKSAIYKFPKLGDLQFHKVMNAEELYIKLAEYLAPKDITVNNQTDIEKIITHGFDKVKSFRNRK